MIMVLRRALRAFHQAVEAPRASREQALRDICSGDVLALELARTMHALDDRQLVPASLICEAVGDLQATTADSLGSPTQPQIPDFIDSYRVVCCLGWTETSAVYRVAHPLGETDLALKTIRPDRLSDRAVAAFNEELEKLRTLRHPCIVKPLQSVSRACVGEASNVPYFVMPLIRGITIEEYGRSAIRDDKLWLFAKICDAIDAAHRDGVVHGDLSANNILVDAAGVPHILDFGIANHIKHRSELTARRGNESCAPPEQRDPAAPSLPRWDIHSLGRIGMLYLFPGECALDADLSAILRKASSPDPERRYQSIAELKDDLKRYRTGYPVVALEHRALLYPLMKWVSRKRVLAVVIAFLLIGCLGLGWQLSKERQLLNSLATARQERLANERRWRNELREIAPGELCDIVEEGMDRGESRVQTSQALFRRILMPTRSVDVSDTAWAEVLLERGSALGEIGDHSHAIDLLRQASVIFDRSPGFETQRVEAARSLALVHVVRSEFAQAETLLTHAAAIHGASEVSRALATADLAWALRMDGRFREALPLLRSSSAALATASQASDLDRTQVEYRRVETERLLGGEAGPVVDAARIRVEATKLYFGNETHPAVLAACADLAQAKSMAGQRDAAERLYEQILPALQSRRWPMHPDTLQARSDYAALVMDRKDFATAQSLFEGVLRDCRVGLGEKHLRTAAAWYLMGIVHSRQKHADDARAAFEGAISAASTTRPDHPYQTTLLTSLGENQLALGDLEGAERTLLRAFEILRIEFEPGHGRVQRVVRALANLYGASGRLADQGAWAARLTPQLQP